MPKMLNGEIIPEDTQESKDLQNYKKLFDNKNVYITRRELPQEVFIKDITDTQIVLGLRPNPSYATLNPATNTEAGLMSSTDKDKLDNISSGPSIDYQDLSIGARTPTTLELAITNGINAILDSATQAIAGLLSAVDKAKLDTYPPVYAPTPPQNLGQGSHTANSLEITIDNGGSNTTINEASTSQAGLMSASDATALRRQQLMYFKDDYIPGDLVEPGTVVLDDDYLCMALVQTSDRAAPQFLSSYLWGSSYGAYELPDNPAWANNSVLNDFIITAQRYVAPTTEIIDSYRIWASELTTEYHYELWLVLHPGTVDEIRDLLGSYRPNIIGWNLFNIPPKVVREGTVFDIALLKVSDATDVIFTPYYDYKQTNGNPSQGELYHQNNTTEMRVHKTDENDSDWTTELEGMQPGGLIEADGTVWNINEVDVRGSHVRFHVTPGYRISEDKYTFNFTTKQSYNLPYVTIADHYTTAPGIQGGFSDISYTGIVWNNNAHGIDIRLREVYISPDWRILVLPSSVNLV